MSGDEGRLESLLAAFPGEKIDEVIYCELAEIFFNECGYELPELVQITFHESMAIPHDETGGSGPSQGATVHASPMLYNRAYFSNVALQGADEQGQPMKWYGQIIALIRFSYMAANNSPVRKELALVRYFEGARRDTRTGFPILQRSPYKNLVDIEMILRPIHIVQRYGEVERFHLNTDKDL